MGADDLAPYQALRLGRVLDLLGHRDSESSVEQFAEIAVKGMVRNTAHRCFDGVVLAATRQRDSQDRGCRLRILEEQLVEISHTVQQQRRTGLLLELQVLAKHGSHFHDPVFLSRRTLIV
jgi:hypothetical protein